MKSIVAIGTAMIAGLLVAAPAYAHPKLVSATPADKATASNVTKLSLTFSEKLTPAFSGFELSMSDGMTMKVATKLSDDGKSLIGTPAGSFMSGAYKIAWHATSADDGHRMDGSLMFKVK